jgi:hypothetical protein
MFKKIVIYCGLCPTFLVEGNAKFQLEVSENKDVIFLPVQVHGPLEIYPRTPKGSVNPRLRTPALEAWMFLCVYSVFVLSCVGSGLATG